LIRQPALRGRGMATVIRPFSFRERRAVPGGFWHVLILDQAASTGMRVTR